MVSVRSTPGMSGWPGKWPSKIGLTSGTVERASRWRAARSKTITRSIISKYSRRIPDESLGRSAGSRNQGRSEQVDDPHSLYTRPKTRFGAGFIGRTNFIEGTAGASEIVFDHFALPKAAVVDGTSL